MLTDKILSRNKFVKELNHHILSPLVKYRNKFGVLALFGTKKNGNELVSFLRENVKQFSF